MLHLGEHAAQWSNLVGKIIKEYPMYYPSWHKIKEEEKKAGFLEKLMTPNIRFKLWTKIKNGIDHHMAKVYINNKSDLKAKHWIVGPDGTCDVQASNADLLRTSSRQSGIRRLTIGLILSTLPEPFKMLKTGQRTRSSASMDPSSETREYPSLIQTLFDTHTHSGEFAQDEARVQCEIIRLRDLGATPTGVPYTEDPIMAMVRERKQRGHILGVGRVLAGQGRDAISINEPQGAYTDADVDEIKEDNKWLRKELIMLRTIVRSDDRMSQLLT
ncbi:hypothetical protein Tco_1540973 [Tanacetum coccineum]